jgi:hypothetical protein
VIWVLEDAAEPGYQVYVEGAWKPGLEEWVVDPEQLMITAFELRDGEFAQVDSAGADDEVSLDFGVGTVTLRHLLADR